MKLKLPDIHTKRVDSSTKLPFLSDSALLTQETISLFEIKQQRKIIENDTKALTTRLTNLRKEESKMKKNIEDIQHRTLELIELKAKQELQLVKNDYYN